MKILIDARKAKNLNAGLGQTAYHVANELAKHQSKVLKFTFLLPRKLKGLFGKRVKYKSAKKLYLKHPCFLGKYDILHLTQPHTRFKLEKIRAKIILTVNDLHFLVLTDNHAATKKKWRHGLQYALDHCSSIVCISNYTKNLLVKHMQTHNKPINVIYPGLGLKDNHKTKQPNIKPNKPFLFAFGATNLYKQPDKLILMMKHLQEYQLVLAGYLKNTDYLDELKKLITANQLEDNIIFTGEISEAEKIWCYQHCVAFCFPSLQEGFGLPPVEAMYFGRPVFVSNISSLPEVCGPEAYYWENFDSNYMAEILRSGLKDFENNSEKKQKIKNWAKQYSWETAAKKYINLYSSSEQE